MSKKPSKPDRERNHKQGPGQNTQDLNSGDICKVGPWQGKGSLKKIMPFYLPEFLNKSIHIYIIYDIYMSMILAFRTGEKVQQVKVLAAKPDALSSTPRPITVKGEN